MTAWDPEVLARIDAAEELRIASHRPDGTLRRPIPIWHAGVDGALYVRSAYGPENGWFRRAARARTGRVSAGGVEQDVSFERLAADDPLHGEIDAALRAKYARYPQYVAPIVTDVSRTATLRVLPAD